MMKYLVAALLVLFSRAAPAALSSASSSIFGPASLTQDSEQGLYWLTPTATLGLSFAQVSSLLATDPRFIGFHVASVAELTVLYAQAEITDVNAPGYGALYGTQTNVAGVQFLQGLTGITYSARVGGQDLAETAAFVGEPFVSPVNGFLSTEIGNVVLRSNVPTNTGPMDFASAYTTWGSVPVGEQLVGVGTWLVSPVPELPGLIEISLGLVTLMGMGAAVRRRKSRCAAF